MNTTNLFRLGAVLLLGGALVAALFIFNGDDDDTVDSEERRELRDYFTELNDIQRTSDTAVRDLQIEYQDANENLEHAKEYFPQYVTTYQSYIDQAQAIDPPGFVSDEHTELVSAARAIQTRNRTLLTQLNETTDVSQLAAIFERTAESREMERRWRHACADLGDIARQYNIEAASITGCTRPIEIHQTVGPTDAP